MHVSHQPPTPPPVQWALFSFVSVKTFRPNNYTPGWVWLPKDTELNHIVCSKKLARLETDWSSIHQPPTPPPVQWALFSFVSVKTFRPNNYTPGWVWLPKDTELNHIVCSKKLARLETDWSSIRPRKRLQP